MLEREVVRRPEVAGRPTWVPSSTPTQRVYQLDPVALLERALGMRAARNDLAIHFHRDPPILQTELAEQARHIGVRLHFEGFSVQFNLHARRVAELRSGGILSPRRRGCSSMVEL